MDTLPLIAQTPIDGAVVAAVSWLKLAIEIISALFVALGVCVAVARFCRGGFRLHRKESIATRLSLAHYLSVALEFQLGADILETAIAPSWEQLGKLAAVATLRTGLNYFLTLEMDRERQRNGGTCPE